MDPARRAAIAALAVLAAALAIPAASHAEPYLAVRSGAKCMTCHVNPTGGGKRTEFGSIYGQTELPARRLDATPWSGRMSEHVAVGGDLRASLDAASIPNASDTLEFNTRGQIYLEVQPLVDRLTLYLDERVVPGAATSREAFAMLWFGERSAYVKAGRMFVPFGLRIEDDTAFIREVSGTTFNSSDDGIEGGLELGSWSASLALTNGAGGGAETNRSKQITALASYVRPLWRAGASFSANSTEGAERDMQSAFAGLRTGSVSWIASAVWISDESPASGRTRRWASLAEGNWAFARGHNLKLAYEYYDPSRDVREDQRERYSALWEYTPFQFTQLRAGVRKNEGIPQNDAQNSTELFLQWHVFF
jgi:hypothetical protein